MACLDFRRVGWPMVISDPLQFTPEELPYLSANSKIWDEESRAAYYADRNDEDKDDKIEHCGLVTTIDRITVVWLGKRHFLR